jgi:hypothetical protein
VAENGELICKQGILKNLEGSACEATELLYHYFLRELGLGGGGSERSDKNCDNVRESNQCLVRDSNRTVELNVSVDLILKLAGMYNNCILVNVIYIRKAACHLDTIFALILYGLFYCLAYVLKM